MRESLGFDRLTIGCRLCSGTCFVVDCRVDSARCGRAQLGISPSNGAAVASHFPFVANVLEQHRAMGLPPGTTPEHCLFYAIRDTSANGALSGRGPRITESSYLTLHHLPRHLVGDIYVYAAPLESAPTPVLPAASTSSAAAAAASSSAAPHSTPKVRRNSSLLISRSSLALSLVLRSFLAHSCAVM